MKKFCNCNSKWDYSQLGNSDLRERQVQLNFLPGADWEDYSVYCYDCDMWPWYDADYENMMHDLKSMNT